MNFKMGSTADEDLHANGFFEGGCRNLSNGGFAAAMAAEAAAANGLLDDVDVSDPSLFYSDFPPLPDFPCMSSSSSSSTTVAAAKSGACCGGGGGGPTTSSSSASTASSATSWAVLRSDADHDPVMDQISLPPPSDQTGQGLGSVDQCMDMMESFGCIDLLESNDVWDPSPLFEENDVVGDQNSGAPRVNDSHSQLHPRDSETFQLEQSQPLDQLIVQGGESTTTTTATATATAGEGSEDLGMVFFEWLKNNKEMISAEDLRNIKIKKSTIEAAARRLGGGKEGMKQLLKLILQWVQNHHLNTKRAYDGSDGGSGSVGVGAPKQPLAQAASNPNGNIQAADANPSFSTQTWLPPPPPLPASFVVDPASMVPPPPPPPPGFSPMMGYSMGVPDPYLGGAAAYPLPPTEYNHVPSWAPVQFPPPPPPPYYGQFSDGGYMGYMNPNPNLVYPGSSDTGIMRIGSSATKEARKKRMARQRRVFQHHNRAAHNHHHQQNQMGELQTGPVGIIDNCGGQQVNHGNWVYWPTPAGGPGTGSMAAPPMQLVDRMAVSGNSHYQRQATGIEKKQGWKTEKNLRFLLQKVLKQSDVGNLGRIVLPKKEAETHLPELEARDGIPIAMEDIGTSRVWNMRYRFWPNNKSRMYLLENTGDFVRSNGLQEGDFIVIYSDVKCGKYMIRGVKVRTQQQGAKPDTKKPLKMQKTQGSSSPAGNVSSASLTTQKQWLGQAEK